MIIKIFFKIKLPMKKIKLSILTLFTFIITSLIFYSCTSESETNEVQNKISAKQLEFGGIEHNEILNKTFDFIIKNESKMKSLKSKANKMKLIEEFMVSQIENNQNYSSESSNLGVKFIRDAFKKRKSNLKSKNNSIIVSEIEAIYLNRLDEVINNSSYSNKDDINLAISNIINLENEIEKDESLTNEQLITLFSATQTAKHSYQYWVENMHNWYNLSSEHKKTNFQKRDGDGHANGCQCLVVGGAIVGADVKGAVAGAVGAAIVNVVPVAGQVTYGAAIVGTAATNSALEAIDQFLDWFSS
jgi:hypothetical protein